MTLGLLSALGYAPNVVQDRLFDLLLSRASAVMTNVPGPQNPLYLAGSQISQVMFWVPQAGGISMGVSILSFNGQVQFGVVTDAAVIPDPEAVIARFEPEFEQLLYYVLMNPWGSASVDVLPVLPEPIELAPKQKPSIQRAVQNRLPRKRAPKKTPASR